MTSKILTQKILSLRVDGGMHAQIMAACAEQKIRPSDFYRDALQAQLDEQNRLSLFELKVTAMISGAGAHLRQVASEVMTEVEDVARNVATEVSGLAITQADKMREALDRLASLPQFTGTVAIPSQQRRWTEAPE
ncbi:hypothetical protein [Xanthomonas sp. NCPPB 2632]|uniref:hypothetical protein n=1 Tax=Xanthomonas sp. NCPPB 2632 TaxID=3240912 RepID=UPI003513A7A2